MGRWCLPTSRSCVPRTRAHGTAQAPEAPPHRCQMPRPASQAPQAPPCPCSCPLLQINKASVSELHKLLCASHCGGEGGKEGTWLWPPGLGERVWGRAGLQSQDGFAMSGDTDKTDRCTLGHGWTLPKPTGKVTRSGDFTLQALSTLAGVPGEGFLTLS